VAQDRLIVYVDGFNLYHGMHDRWRCAFLWLDLETLARDLRPRSSLERVKYFTAPVLDEPDALSRQSSYIAALKASSGGLIEVTQGRYQRKTMTCRACGHSYRRYEEKETDVNIATALVSDAAFGRMDSALVVSADSDLVPAVKAAKAASPGLFIAAAFPPKRFSAELKALMPNSLHIGSNKIKQSQLADSVQLGGKTWTRPAKWALPNNS